MGKIVFVDAEVTQSGKIADVAAYEKSGVEYHGANLIKFRFFVRRYEYVVGHNIVEHDYKYLSQYFRGNSTLVDTLYMSPILFPKKPYHSLTKDEKLFDGELNNPLNDSIKCSKLFYDEVDAFKRLDLSLQKIYCSLLSDDEHFFGFFKYVKAEKTLFVLKEIKTRFKNLICDNADISKLVKENPIELAYALAIITVDESLYVAVTINPLGLNESPA